MTIFECNISNTKQIPDQSKTRPMTIGQPKDLEGKW